MIGQARVHSSEGSRALDRLVSDVAPHLQEQRRQLRTYPSVGLSDVALSPPTSDIVDVSAGITAHGKKNISGSFKKGFLINSQRFASPASPSRNHAQVDGFNQASAEAWNAPVERQQLSSERAMTRRMMMSVMLA